MPSKSGRQHRLMMAAAHNPQIAKKSGVPQKVAREFVMADVGRKMAPPPKANKSVTKSEK